MNASNRDLGSDLMVVAGRLTRRVSRETRGQDTAGVWRGLSVVEQYEPITISALARAYGCSQPAATKLVARLESEGLARRAGDATDARISRISLTSAGHERLRAERAIASDYLRPMMDSLSAADTQAMWRTVEILTRFIDEGDSALTSGATAGESAEADHAHDNDTHDKN